MCNYFMCLDTEQEEIDYCEAQKKKCFCCGEKKYCTYPETFVEEAEAKEDR